MKKTFLLLIFLTLLLSLYSCGNGQADKTFIFASNGTFAFFDPHNSNTSQQVNLYEQVYEGLTMRNSDFLIDEELGLATSWKLESDTVWRFMLRKGVKFHNGADFTAEDVKASFDRAKEGTEGTISIAKNIIIDIEIINDYEILVHTKSYVPVLPSAITSLLIMDKDWITENNTLSPISSTDTANTATIDSANGTGPYKLVSLTPNEEIVFQKNENYWNTAYKGEIENIKYKSIEQDSTRLSALLAGDIHLAFPVPIQDWDRIEKNRSVDLYTGIEARPIFLGLDQYRDTLIGADAKSKGNPLKDKRVRQAINLAIDIDTINEKIMKGKALPIGIISAPGLGGHPDDEDLVAPYPYDPVLAKKLLAEAGYKNGFSLTLDAPNDRYINDEAMAQAITNMLAKVNIKVNLRTQPRSTYFQLIFQDRETSMYMLGWHPVAAHDLDIVTRLLAYPSDEEKLGGFNIGKFANSEVTDIARKLGKIRNANNFDNLIAQAYRISKQEYAYVPLLAPPLSVAINSKYTFKVSTDDEISFRQIRRK